MRSGLYGDCHASNSKRVPDALGTEKAPTQNKKKNTVYDYLELWDRDGTLERIHHALYVAVREEKGACHYAP